MQEQYLILFVIFVAFFVTIVAANVMAVAWNAALSIRMKRVIKRVPASREPTMVRPAKVAQEPAVLIGGVPGSTSSRTRVYGS